MGSVRVQGCLAALVRPNSTSSSHLGTALPFANADSPLQMTPNTAAHDIRRTVDERVKKRVSRRTDAATIDSQNLTRDSRVPAGAHSTHTVGLHRHASATTLTGPQMHAKKREAQFHVTPTTQRGKVVPAGSTLYGIGVGNRHPLDSLPIHDLVSAPYPESSSTTQHLYQLTVHLRRAAPQ